MGATVLVNIIMCLIHKFAVSNNNEVMVAPGPMPVARVILLFDFRGRFPSGICRVVDNCERCRIRGGVDGRVCASQPRQGSPGSHPRCCLAEPPSPLPKLVGNWNPWRLWRTPRVVQ